MVKTRQRPVRRQLKSVPVVHQTTVIYPLVTQLNPDDREEFSAADFQALENAGGVKFEPSVQRALERIAAGWISHDRDLQSPRPGQFKKRLQQIESALKRTISSLDLNKGDSPILDRHLYIWLINAGFDGADDLLQSSTLVMQEGRKLLDLLWRAKGGLPLDTGSSRPMDEDRFIIYLADQFETSGVQATAFSSSHSEFGYGDTLFRNFVHKFYELLPIKSRRTSSGLDEAIIRALEYRRRHS
jgi:hypothetical protein